jgi:rhodanese-related sulfurtransferase
MPQWVSPANVKAMLADGGELAILDLREELTFSEGHLLWARSLPLSRLELHIARLVPRRSTRIVLCDGDDGLAVRGAEVLERYGYGNLLVLAGGVEGWKQAGFELFSGVHVPSKAFGEFVEHDSGTPSIDPQELDRLMRRGTDMVVLDSRPQDEYVRMTIPNAINVPGAELVLRMHDIAPSPDTLVVVNCAGRTRSIIGAQSLINAGVPNKVVALRNGTMGWNLAGFDCEHGQTRRAPSVSQQGFERAKEAAQRVAQRYGVQRTDDSTLERWRSEQLERTLYIFDVRDPPEYAAGHVAGAISAPGGQLVQATDLWIGTLGARIVLVDDKEVRAVMTGSWLRQMGMTDVYVLVAHGEETGFPAAPVLGLGTRPDLAITPGALADLLARDQATVIDLSLSRNYRAGHIPGAWFAIRAQMQQALALIPARGTLVLTSEDGLLAEVAAPETTALAGRPVRYLTGGNRAWHADGHALVTQDPRMASAPGDAWLKPYERPGDPTQAMKDYLAWEIDLLDRLDRDGTTNFARFADPVTY